MATFHIDDQIADDGYLTVEVDNIATVIIQRCPWDDSVKVEICTFEYPGEGTLATTEVTDAILKLTRKHFQRKNRK